MNPTLTDEQQQAIRRAEGTGPVSVEDPTTHTRYVLLRADLYEQVRPLVEDKDLDPREAYPLLEKMMREDDAHDPLLSAYQAMAPSPRA